MKKLIALTVVVAVLGLFAVGCGGKKEAPKSIGITPSAGSNTEKKEAEKPTEPAKEEKKEEAPK